MKFLVIPQLKLYNKSSCSHFSTATGKDFGTRVIILNPGSTMFWGSLRSQIYIDKSGLIRQMNTLLYTEQRYVF